MDNQKFNLLKEGKTNWKYILIVLVLAIIVGGVALWCLTRQELPYQPSEIKKPEKSVETADWKTYRDEEYGFEFRYPQEWGNITFTKTERTYFRFEKEDHVYFFITDIEHWPNGIYEQYYEGILLLKINMSKQKQYIEEASEGDKCYEPESSQLSEIFEINVEDCQVIFLNETGGIKAQLDYPYFEPPAQLKVYTFYKQNYQFSFRLGFSEFYVLFGQGEQPAQEIIEKFKNLLKNKVIESPYTSPYIINLSKAFDQMLSTFRFLE